MPTHGHGTARPASLTPPVANRFAGWATLHSLTCPSGHHIRQDALVLDHGALRCKQLLKSQERPGAKAQVLGECGAWLYVLASIGWTVERDASGCERIVLGDDVFVASVTWSELQAIRAQRLGAARVLDFLGIPRISLVKVA